MDDPHSVLRALGAPARLVTHARLVTEAGELLLGHLARIGAQLDGDFVRAGIVLHDAGKALHPEELDAPGARHEPDGERALLALGVEPRLARVCRSHAQWASLECSLEELLVALADTLWKGARKPALEERVIDAVAARAGRPRWELFVELDDLFESVAAGGLERLSRSAER